MDQTEDDDKAWHDQRLTTSWWLGSESFDTTIGGIRQELKDRDNNIKEYKE